jgi:hypothetical protein
MNELIGLIWALGFGITGILFLIKNTIGAGKVSLILAFAIIGGLAIVNCDYLTNFKWLGMDVTTARKEINTYKSDALSDIAKEVAKHKESIAMLVSSGNDMNDKLEEQKRMVNSMIEKAKEVDTRLKDDQKNLEGVKEQVILANNNTQSIYNATKELSLVLTRITYLQSVTKGDFGGPRSQKAFEIIDENIKKILQMMIPDPTERSAFMYDLVTALPSR